MEPTEKIHYREVLLYLTRDEIKELAKQHGISYYQARAIINGRRRNYAFLALVVAKAEQNKETINKAKSI